MSVSLKPPQIGTVQMDGISYSLEVYPLCYKHLHIPIFCDYFTGYQTIMFCFLPIASSNAKRTAFPWSISCLARLPIHLKPVSVSYSSEERKKGKKHWKAKQGLTKTQDHVGKQTEEDGITCNSSPQSESLPLVQLLSGFWKKQCWITCRRL